MFDDVELPNVVSISAPFENRINRIDTPFRHGGAATNLFYGTRQIAVSGVWLPTAGQTFSEMEIDFEAFRASLSRRRNKRLSLRLNWFFNASILSFTDSERSPGSIEYDITFFMNDPRQYKLGPNAIGDVDAETATTITFGTDTSMPDGLDTPVRMELTASSGYATEFTMTPTYSDDEVTGGNLVWTPGATGITKIYFDRQYAERGGIDVTEEFSGDFFAWPANTDVNVACSPSSGHNITAIIYYREATT